MKIEFETSNGNFCFYKAPYLAFYTDHTLKGVCYVETKDGRIMKISTEDKKVAYSIFVKDLTEEQWSEVVDPVVDDGLLTKGMKTFKCYDNDEWVTYSATESGKSLMDSLGVYLKNPYADEEGYLNHRVCSICQDNKTGKWVFVDGGVQGLFDKAQDKTGNWLLIKYL